MKVRICVKTLFRDIGLALIIQFVLSHIENSEIEKCNWEYT